MASLDVCDDPYLSMPLGWGLNDEHVLVKETDVAARMSDIVE